MKILVPTDFSDNANNALDFAKQLALKENSSVTLFYAFYAVYDFAAQATEILAQIEEDAKKSMKKAVKEGQEMGLTIDYKLMYGSVATSVTAYAYKEDYDLIVMGTQGASGIKKTLMGSNTGHVVKDSMIPVLAVPHQAKWGNTNKIAVAVELENEEEKFFEKLFGITSKFQFPYDFFHISNTAKFDKLVEFRGLESVLKEKYHEVELNFKVIQDQDVNSGITQYLNANEGAMLVMFNKDKTFFEYLFNKSNTLEMAYHTHVPLLIIKK